ANPRRLCLFSFHDNQGLVDDYVVVLLQELRRFVDKIVVCVQGPLTEASRQVLSSVAEEICTSSGAGRRLASYAQGFERLGCDGTSDYSEVLLVDDTYYGPLFPLDELFEKMDRRPCDFWGITAHPERKPDRVL
ncbi:rhamnan synthesis F family protein, partial [Staphylococcus aureus]|uniref:rhamnan synthesis F family protein n=1 Tax=Staphylococcus aureus TaxID=1280 RepID=UPI0039BE73AD